MFRKLLKDKFLTDSLINIAGAVVPGFFSYLFQFVASRKLSVANYGEFQALLSLAAILGAINLTVSVFTVKHASVFAQNDDRASSQKFSEWLNEKIIRWSSSLLLVFFASGIFFYPYLRLTSPTAFVLSGFYMFFSVIGITWTATLAAWHKFFLAALAGLVTAMTKIIIGYPLILFLPAVGTAMLVFLISAASGWLISHRFVYKNINQKIGLEAEPENSNISDQGDWKKYFPDFNFIKNFLPAIIYAHLIILLQNVDMILAKNILDKETAGHYGVLSQMGEIVLYICLAVTTAFFPSMCAEGHNGKRLEKQTTAKAYGLILLIGLSATTVFFFLPALAIKTLFGVKYLVFKDYLWYFGVMATTFSLFNLEASFAYARHDKRISYIMSAMATLMIGGAYFWGNTLNKLPLIFSTILLVGYLSTLFINLWKK